MIDLHTHTTASDGTDNPADLVRHAVESGVRLLAITDHDTFAGWEAARPAAEEAGIRLVPGVELSTTLDEDMRSVLGRDGSDIHLLVYFPGMEPGEEFREWVGTLEDSRWERNRRLLRRLEECGIRVEEEELRGFGGLVAGRVHLARILRDRKIVATIDEAFRRFLGEDAAAYVPRCSPIITDVLRRVRAAGGIASLAHPIRVWGPNRAAGEALTSWLARRGLDAIEVWHSEQSPAYSNWVMDLARRNELRVTGGSDYHGANKPSISVATGYGHQPLVPVSAFAQSWKGVDTWVEIFAGAD